MHNSTNQSLMSAYFIDYINFVFCTFRVFSTFLHRFLTEALGEVDRLKEVERCLKSELSLVKRDKATLWARVEELEAAQ